MNEFPMEKDKIKILDKSIIGKTIKGSELNDIELYRITNKREKHNDFQYNDGWNEDSKEDGIYFCKLDDIFQWFKWIGQKNWIIRDSFYNDDEIEREDQLKSLRWIENNKYWIRKVTLDNDEDVYVDYNKLKAKRIFLETRILLSDFLIGKREFCIKKLHSDSSIIRYLPKEMEGYHELCMQLVTLNGILLEYIPEESKDEDICSIAIQGNDGVLSLVPIKLKNYKEICLEALQKNGLALAFIPKKMRNREICLEAVKQNELAFEFVPKNIQKYVEKRIKNKN